MSLSKLLTTAVGTLALALGIYVSPLTLTPVHAQSQNARIPFTSAYISHPEISSISGFIHVSLSSTEDESGCMRYTLKYNSSSLDVPPAEFTNANISSGRLDGEPVTVTVCDANACYVDFRIDCTLTLVVTHPQSPSTWNYFEPRILIRWNRCTNEWSIGYFIAF